MTQELNLMMQKYHRSLYRYLVGVLDHKGRFSKETIKGAVREVICHVGKAGILEEVFASS